MVEKIIPSKTSKQIIWIHLFFAFHILCTKTTSIILSIQLNPVPIWHYNNRKIQFCVEMTKDDIK